jgi:hypothetical protein
LEGLCLDLDVKAQIGTLEPQATMVVDQRPRLDNENCHAFLELIDHDVFSGGLSERLFTLRRERPILRQRRSDFV